MPPQVGSGGGGGGGVHAHTLAHTRTPSVTVSAFVAVVMEYVGWEGGGGGWGQVDVSGRLAGSSVFLPSRGPGLPPSFEPMLRDSVRNTHTHTRREFRNLGIDKKKKRKCA